MNEVFTRPECTFHYCDQKDGGSCKQNNWCHYQKMPNEEIIKRVNAWQNAGFIHPLTCRWKSSHRNLIPLEVNGKVVLRCLDCKSKYQDQLNIPPSVLSVTPEFIEQEKERLKKLGFKFDESGEAEAKTNTNDMQSNDKPSAP